MQDIVKAIAVEKEYYNLMGNGIHSFHLIDKIKECGFETLEQYAQAKRDYQFGLVEFAFVEQPMPGGVAEIFKMIESNMPGVLFVDWEDTYVVCGTGGMKTYDHEYCEQNNITVFPLYAPGGTIVGSVGDFSFGVCVPVKIGVDAAFLLASVGDIIQRHTPLPVSVDGNDILVDGRKICGSASYQKGDVFMHIMHFSFKDWSDLISNICNKNGKPVGYVDFMTRQVFKQEVMEWLRVRST